MRPRLAMRLQSGARVEVRMGRTARSIVSIAIAGGMAAVASAQPAEESAPPPAEEPAPPEETQPPVEESAPPPTADTPTVTATTSPAATGIVRGRVIDPDGDPVAGAFVSFAGSQAGAIAEADGTFVIEGAAAGRHRIGVEAAGFVAGVVDVDVRAGRTTDVIVHVRESDTPAETIVVIGSRSPEKRLDAPVTVEVVGEHDLRTAAGPSYLSALSRVKGIDFSDAGLGDQRISARGFATQFNSRMLTMVDGRLATLPGNGLPQGNLLPTTSLDMKTVEVVVGPASALYGPNAHTGVINVVTKTPWDQSGAELSLKGGSRGLAGGAGRLAGTIANDVGWKLNGEYLRGVDFAPEATHTYGMGTYEGDLVGDYDIESAKTDGMLYYRRGDTQVSAGGSFSDSTGFSITNAGRNHLRDWHVQTQTATLSTPYVYAHVTRTATDAGKSYQLDRLARTVEAMGGIPTDPAALDALRDSIAFVDASSLYDSELQLRYQLAGVKLTAGGQARRYLPSSAGSYLDDADTAIRIDEMGAYAQGDTTILDDRLRIAAAARVDHHDLYGAQFSPKLALQYEVAPSHNVRVGYNRAFKSPTILENYLKLNTILLGNRTGFVIHDDMGAEIARIAPLVPEQVDALEAGYKGAIGSSIYVDAVAYWSWYRDFISPLTQLANPAGMTPTFATYPDGTPVAAGTPVEGTLFTYQNFGRAQVRGVDVGVDYRPREQLALSLSSSLIDLASFSNDSATQRDLTLNAPAMKVRGSAQVSDVLVDHGYLRVDGRAHSSFAFASGFWNSEALLGGDVPARFVLDATLGWADPESGWSVSASVANITDNHTPDVLGAPRPGRYGWVQLGYRYDGLDVASH
jgi:outer membrane receptor for ferrienterochelin and colicins